MGVIIAHSGAHGTGKTTSVYQHAAELKIMHPGKTVSVLTETARFCPYPINKNTSEHAQLWILTRQINKELSMLPLFDFIVSDRTAVDAIAYTIAAGFDSLAGAMVDILHHHVHIYKEIRFHKTELNKYCHNDGIRDSSDQAYRDLIQTELLSLYEIFFPVRRHLSAATPDHDEVVFSFV